MRNKILAANWKMNLLKDEAIDLLKNLSSIEVPKNRKVILGLPFIYLLEGNEILKSTDIKTASQNCYTKEKGAFTGEISVKQLKSLGTEYVIIGHSERRMYFNEDSKFLNEKLKAVINEGLTPIFCIGEPDKERENKTYEAYLYKQLKEGLDGITKDEAKKIIYAYEPIWAIGSGKAMNASDCHSMSEFIRNTLDFMYEGIKEDVHILYGGSVNASNIDDILKSKQVDGVLVGGASLKFEEFKRIVLFEE